MAKPKRIISQIEIDFICESYINNVSMKQLQKQTKLQLKQIKNILLDRNIKILSALEQKQNNSYIKKKDYFANLGELECYVLGLIFGDGCVYYNPKKYKYALTMTSNDLDILNSCRLLFGNNIPITKRKTSNAYNFVINSKFLCKELINKFHLQSPKSNNLIWPNLDNDMYKYFISGLLSTDGCVRIDKRRANNKCAIEFSYSSNCLPFIKNLQNFLHKKLNTPNDIGIKINSTKRKNTNYSLRFSGTNASKILDYIYSQSSSETRCERKYNIYNNYINVL